MKSRTLLDISDDLQSLDDLLEEVGGDISDPMVERAVDAWFEELDRDMSSKVDNYAALITELEQRAATRKAEADRLAKRAKSDAGSASFLKNRLKAVMEMRGIKKLDTSRFVVSVAGNGGKQPLIVEDDKVPDTFKFTPPAMIDKDRIREFLDRGETLPFARLGERGTRLSIR
jgi:hypothetical protein